MPWTAQLVKEPTELPAAGQVRAHSLNANCEGTNTRKYEIGALANQKIHNVVEDRGFGLPARGDQFAA